MRARRAASYGNARRAALPTPGGGQSFPPPGIGMAGPSKSSKPSRATKAAAGQESGPDERE